MEMVCREFNPRAGTAALSARNHAAGDGVEFRDGF